MAKKKKKAVTVDRKRTVDAKPNLFESLYTRKKFDVLGRKRKESVKKRGQARKEGIEKRKGTLLVEYKQRQKANSFQDKRFGENDEGLSAEDKALARFQKQKLKEIAGRHFGLEDTDGGFEELTHLGAPLKDDFGEDDRLGFHDDDDVYDMDPETEASLHFGGGFQPKSLDTSTSKDEEPQRKSKKQVMEEVMAKSKMYRAEKAKQKEEDLDAAEQLDQDFSELLKSGNLSTYLKPKGQKDSQKAEKGSLDAAYDIARREMAFDNRAKVGERTKTEQEIAQEEVERLETLEAERKKRMAGEDIEEKKQEPEGGYAKRRAKRKREDDENERHESTGDALEDDFDMDDKSQESSDEDSEDGKSGAKLGLDERRQKRAAGDHPLQEKFRETAKALSQKFGLLESSSEEEEESEDESESINSEKEEKHQTDSEDDSASPEQILKQSNNLDPKANGDVHNAQPDLGIKHASSDSSKDDGVKGGASGVQPSRKNASSQKDAQKIKPSDIPYKILAPDSYPDFSNLVNGKSSEELLTIIQRIRVSTNVALSEDNKRKIQVFYGILVQHFAILAGRNPIPVEHLNILTLQILEMTSMVPFYAATTAIARLQRLQERLQNGLKDGEASWPSQAQLLLLKLWATIFPASDKRHSVLTPSMLLIGSYLALCPIQTLNDIKAGLFLATLGAQMAASGSRWMPEPLNFSSKVLQILLEESNKESPLFQLSSLSQSEKSEHKKKRRKTSDSVGFENTRLKFGDSEEQSPEQIAEACLVCTMELIGSIARENESLPAFPELIGPSINLLKRLETQESPEGCRSSLQKVLSDVEIRKQTALKARKPLQKIKVQKEIKQYNPRFEEDFVSGRDYDPDRERAERRKLNKQLKSERRGAIRELRKDATYLGEQRDFERDAEEKERKRNLRGNTAWIAKLEQDFRSGGQGGMWKKRRKR